MCDHLVKNATELVAVTYVADGLQVSIDHAGQLGSLVRLADLAQAGSVHPVHLHGGGGDHVDSPFRSTSMMIVCDSGIGLTPGLACAERSSRALH